VAAAGRIRLQSGVPILLPPRRSGGAELHGWLADLLGKLSEKATGDLPSPEGLCGTLRPYQQRGFSVAGLS
jgi:hypothetical protein